MKLNKDIIDYQSVATPLEKKVNGISEKIESNKEKRNTQEIKLKTYRSQITSSRPTIEKINNLLKLHNFDGFYLNCCGDNEEFYKIVRNNGEIANETLSEGEKTFIVFLYFYYLISDEANSQNLEKPRVIIFDDPVSSLDANVLFIVNGIVRNIMEKTKEENSRINQVFILTHNIFFHRLVCHRKSNTISNKPSFCRYFVVGKNGTTSYIESYEENPVNSSYELLWQEIRRKDSYAPSVENSMRRILEYYFETFGGKDLSSLHNEFNDPLEKEACKALVNWMHVGSHFPGDDLHFPRSQEMYAIQRRVLRKIFCIMGHEEHYNMMVGNMGEDSEYTKFALP